MGYVSPHLMLDVWFSRRPIGGVFLEGVFPEKSQR